MSLVLEESVQAINYIKTNKNDSKFFEAYILLALDNLKNNVDKTIKILSSVPQDHRKIDLIL